jgi:hypothetical protein
MMMSRLSGVRDGGEELEELKARKSGASSRYSSDSEYY